MIRRVVRRALYSVRSTGEARPHPQTFETRASYLRFWGGLGSGFTNVRAGAQFVNKFSDRLILLLIVKRLFDLFAHLIERAVAFGLFLVQLGYMESKGRAKN